MEDRWIQNLKKGWLLPINEVQTLCAKAKEILHEENNVCMVFSPIVICGNIKGQFYDLLELFRIGGDIPDTNYLFMGSFVNRGQHSLECAQLLLALKIRFPGNITILRGNQEARDVSSVWGFQDEWNRVYGNTRVWEWMMDTFDYLPLSAIVDSTIFSVHGGISKFARTVDQIRLIDRFRDVPKDECAFNELLWSDPEEIESWAWAMHGAGPLFGENPTNEFLHVNGLSLITRGNQLWMDGYMYWFPKKNLVTICSTPDYQYRMGNKAAILQIKDENNSEMKVFDRAEESMAESIRNRGRYLQYYFHE